MKYIKILETSSYLPKRKITSEELERKLQLEENYIYKRTGIKQRYFIEQEKIEELAINAVKKLKKIKDIGLIIVATTSSDNLMPGIANYIQKQLEIDRCICLDVFAGCSGYINCFDIAKMYIENEKIQNALIVGVDTLSKFTDEKDISTAIILADGAGATLIEATDEYKKYYSNIQTKGINNQILTCKSQQKIYMDGKEIYKYAVKETVENIKETLKNSGETLETIKYIVPHQSNLKIMKSIASRLEIDMDKIYTNIETVGNTFCASIPIALDEMNKKGLLNENDKILLIGYGGGLNTGSILIQI